MNTFQKRAFKYDTLGDLAERLEHQIDVLQIENDSYKESIDAGDGQKWYETEIEQNKEKISVLESLRKELEKL